MENSVLIKVENEIATVTLNRPAVHNAFVLEMFLELQKAFALLDADDRVRVVFLTGAGKNFSAGGDIQHFKDCLDSGSHLSGELIASGAAASLAIRRCEKPVIALLNGAAAGAGFSLALACDYRVMTKESRLVSAFSKMGFVGDSAGAYFLYKMVGLSKLTEVMALSNPIGGEEAFRLGIASRLAPDGALYETALALANDLISLPPCALSSQKRLYNEWFLPDLEEYMKRENDAMLACAKTADHKEAVLAFFEKRKPVFTGK